jgi:hypothetical protein
MRLSTISYWTTGTKRPSRTGQSETSSSAKGRRSQLRKVVKHYENFIVIADIDGNFDKRGLPDTLVLAFYFTPHSEFIVQLIILRNRRDI